MFVKVFFRNILENIAVVIITPPLEICQTEPAIKLRDIYARAEDKRSIMAGIIGKYMGHYFFINPDYYKKFLFRLEIR